MESNEIIVFKNTSSNQFAKIVEEAISYAIISIPFTINRMDFSDLERRILNIVKGKTAEGLFYEFCRQKNFNIDVKSCTTPFYLPDKRDFIWMNYEWDIKNNFLYHENEVLDTAEYIDLPALIPNRHDFDQWSKRKDKIFPQTKGVRYLFTFMKNLDTYTANHNFVDIIFTADQMEFIYSIYSTHREKNHRFAPYELEWYWQEFYKYSNNSSILYTIKHQPALIITAYADEQNWHQFKDVNGQSFGKNYFRTLIRNRACPIKELPSFKSLLIK